MTLILRPRVLLLGEPTTGVDVGTRARLLPAVTTLAAEDGTAVVYSTRRTTGYGSPGPDTSGTDHQATITLEPAPPA